MKIELLIDEKWSASQFSNHLRNLTKIYRFEIVSALYYSKRFELSGTGWSKYLVGHDQKIEFPEMDSFDLQILSVSYASPTTEILEGVFKGVTGIADLIERMIFFKNTRRVKELSVATAEVELQSKKLGVAERAIDILKKSGATDDEVKVVRELYFRSILDTYQLVERGALERVAFNCDHTLRP